MFSRFNDEFGKRDLESITPDEILSFLTRLTEGNNQTTKRNRYSSLKAFFNYIRNTIDFEIKNPCDTPILRKIFREKRPQQWKIIEKDLIDEIIFKTENPRNRIMMELMAKGGMRIGEVLKIRPIDVKDRKITLPDPKSGLETEIVYIPQKIADRLREYIQDKGIGPEKRIFPITYNAARIMVKKAGELDIPEKLRLVKRVCCNGNLRGGTALARQQGTQKQQKEDATFSHGGLYELIWLP